MRLLLTPFLLALLLAVPACKKSSVDAGDAVVESASGDATAAAIDAVAAPKKKGQKKGRKKGRKKAVAPIQDSAIKAPMDDRKMPTAVAETAPPASAPEAADDTVAPVVAPMAINPTAAAEALRPTPPATVTPPPVRVAVARLLSVVDVNKHLPEKGWIAYGPVQGIPPSETFNSLIYRKPGTNRFVTLLVWDFPQYTQALEKWHELRATYPNAEELKDMFAKNVFFSYRNQVSTLTALHEGSNAVVSVSCHSEVCDDTALYQMAKTAYGRIQ